MVIDKETIEALVQRAKTNDKEAIESIYNAFLPYICILISKIYVSGYDRNDLKQECFLFLMTAIEKYKGSDTFIAYATCTIKNNLMYLLRKKLTHKENPSADLVVQSQNSIEDIVLKKLDVKALNTAIKTLSASERSILSKYFLDDISLMNISKEQNSKYITVVKKKDRAISKLQKKIIQE